MIAGGRQSQLTREELRDVLSVALRAGQLMLENGANTARVEETVQRLGLALGAEAMDVYVTPQGILATAVAHGEHRTRIQRVTRSGVDLSRFAAVVDVSRQAERGELTPEGAMAALDRIARMPRVYGVWMTTASVGLACAAFAVLFGGGLWEFLIVLAAATLAQYLRHTLLHYQLDRLMTTAIVALISSGSVLALATLLQPVAAANVNVAIAIPASALLLVPGVLLVSGAADLFRGDILSGIARATSAFLVILSIGVGLWTLLLLTRAEVTLAPAVQPNLLLALATALLAAGGFAVLFDVPRRTLLFAALGGALAVGVRSVVTMDGLPLEVGAFFAGLTIGVCAELMARWLRVPTSLFAIPAYIPLVPGVPAFRAVLSFVNGSYVAGLADFVRAILIVVAIAVGLGTVNALVRTRAAARS